MKGLVEVLAKALVDNPTPVEVFEAGTPEDAVYRLRVGRDDLGKVIGKKGRTAKAFRTLLAAAGAKQGKKTTLEILEPERPHKSEGEGDAAPAASAGEGDDVDAG